ncbi:hypothetical protein [Lutibacter sp.]|uniref:hypothetical protein n=1 Tax=Lutibacter sp. TaxID=1925666 RepID=UPI0025C07913|nr:hypothetical protein [Lutibacter sp.]MCF6168472.1 hypothetical protein [Lutibacter sp.]
MKNYNTSDLSKDELLIINGGDFWDAAFTVFKTVVKYSSLTGALIVGVGDGVLEVLEEATP